MYSNEVLERFKNPENAGGMKGANGTGKAGEVECGEVVKIYILVDENEVIKEARFKTYGGVYAIAGSDLVCEMIEGETVQNALALSGNDILARLGHVPANKTYVAEVVADAVKSAVEDYYKKKEKDEK